MTSSPDASSSMRGRTRSAEATAEDQGAWRVRMPRLYRCPRVRAHLSGMSDERLRALERAARERPDDLAAGWAFAGELERSGDRLRAHRELARLARQGDAPAIARVLAWSPFSGESGAGASYRARRPGLHSYQHLTWIELEGTARVLGASNDHVFLATRDPGTGTDT